MVPPSSRQTSSILIVKFREMNIQTWRQPAEAMFSQRIAEIPFKVSASYVHQAELQDFRGSLEVGKAEEAG